MRIAAVLALLALAQQPTGWKDPSPHVTRFITVGPDLRLEVLDWGGSGRALVLLAGGGDTAHVFDDFAPKLARDFHVGQPDQMCLTPAVAKFEDDVDENAGPPLRSVPGHHLQARRVPRPGALLDRRG